MEPEVERRPPLLSSMLRKHATLKRIAVLPGYHCRRIPARRDDRKGSTWVGVLSLDADLPLQGDEFQLRLMSGTEAHGSSLHDAVDLKTGSCKSLILRTNRIPRTDSVPPPARALPLRHRYSRLRRPSHRLSPPSASASSGESWPVATRPGCRGIFPTLSLRIFPRMPGPPPPRSHRVHRPVSSPMSSALPNRGLGQLPASPANTIFPRSVFRGCPHCLMFRPPSLLISQIVPHRFAPIAEIFTSEHRVLRCLRTRRIC
jgi:hypothetical protein